MFRIEERNGTSFVYDGETGSLAMIIKSNNKENGVQDDQVVINDGRKGQLLTNSLNKEFCPSVNLPKVTYCNDSDDILSESECKRRFGKHRIKDLYGPVYDQNSFLKIFNLKPNSADDAVQLLRNPHVGLSDLSVEGQQQLSRIAVSDFDFTSTLGQSILQKKRNGNVYVRDAATSVAKYDKYCLSTKRSMFGDCQLRDRQGNFVYQVSYVPRTRSNGHKYVFNKKQRLERLNIIRTGLNRRSRRLKRMCKNVKIHVNRLSEEDIKTWTTRVPRSSVLPGYMNSSVCGERGSPLQPCIDGTIVIQIDDSEDEEVTVSPKPMLTPGTCPFGQAFRWQDGRLILGSSLTRAPLINTAHPIYTNGLTVRALPQPNSSLAVASSSLLKPSVGPRSSSLTLKDAYVATLRPHASEATTDSDSEDSEIEFLGCVPHSRSSSGGPNLAGYVLDSNAEKVPRFLVTNLCQPTLGTQAVSLPGKMNLTHALQVTGTPNGSGQVSSMNRRKIGSPGTQKVPISPFPVKTRFHPQSLGRNLDESPAKVAGTSNVGVRSSTRSQGLASAHTFNERISSDFGGLEADLERLFDCLNQKCALRRSTTSSMLPDVRELAGNFQCHMCGFEEKHYHSAAKRVARHMHKYHGEVDGAVQLLVNLEGPRNESPLIVVQAVSCNASSDHALTASHTIINL